ncbi:MAG: glycosyltransferase family 1 protein [Verrucomicrobiae bacterium]|nr:glycosyltransferase family 1 protein [Verrucomicrobiae bacterium]
MTLASDEVDAAVHQRHDPALRIAVVTETYPPEVNGVALSLARLVAELLKRGHSIPLIRPRQRQEPALPDSVPAVVLTRGIPIPGYPDLRMGLPARRRLLSLWTRRRPDIVHVATEGPLGWSAVRAAAGLGIPVVSEFRTNFHTYSRHYGIGALRRLIAAWLRHFHNRTVRTMVPTRALAADLARDGFHNLTVVGRGVDAARFSPDFRCGSLRRSWGVDGDAPVALYVGRIAAEKNLEVLVAAWNAIRRENPRWRLVVVGDGPARRDLEQWCPGAWFAGMRGGRELAAHFASSDLLLFPSLTETFGNVVPEAMASGLGVLAFDHAAAAELIRHGETGWLARFGVSEHFVELARTVARDPWRVRHVGVQAHRVVQRHTWSGIAARVEGIYREVLPRVAVPVARDVSNHVEAAC